MNVQARARMTPFQLCEALDQFVADNDHGGDLDDRWLANYVRQTTLPVAREIRNNNIGPETREQINAFRAAEIESEMDRKRRELESLERDLKRVKAA